MNAIRSRLIACGAIKPAPRSPGRVDPEACFNRKQELNAVRPQATSTRVGQRRRWAS